MNFTNREKQLLLGNAPVLSRITLYAESGEVLQVFNENDYLVDWDYEDFRYVPDQGFIGQFVERLLDGHLMNIPNNISLEDKEISVEIAIYDSELQEQVYHNYGRFIITKIEKEDTTGSYKFESSDYTKKFNEVYTGGVTFPCTALKLLNSACDQVGVELDTSNNVQAVEYIVPKDGLQAGNYAFLINGTYYNFTLNEDLTEGNLLMLKSDKLILRKVTSDYKIIREEIPYVTSETSSNTVLSDEPYDYYELINDDFIVNDNQFTENNTCRDVVRSVAQLSYTWARINENNKLCLDFIKNDNVDSYDEIDTDKYYEATVTGDKVEPINKVLIGMSQVDGENIVKERDNDLLCVDTIYGETSQTVLPSGYQAVEYIESTGTQYINTNVKVNGTMRVTMDVDISEANGMCLFGGRAGVNSNTFVMWIINGTQFRTDYNTSSDKIINVPSTLGKWHIDKNRSYTTVVNASGAVYRRQQGLSTFSGSRLLYLFAKDQNGTVDNYTKYKLYNCKVYLEDILVRNFIPCYRTSDNVIGLYDIENNQFYTNSGSGTFVKGSNTSSPSPSTPQEIESVKGSNPILIRGNNLFDINKWVGVGITTGSRTVDVDTGTIELNNTSGGNLYTLSGVSGSIGSYIDKSLWQYLIPVKPNTTYTLQYIKSSSDATGASSDSCYYNLLDKNKKTLTLNGFGSKPLNTLSTVTIVTNADTHYISLRFGVRQSVCSITYSDIMVSEGSEILPYEPHQETRKSIDLPVKNLFMLPNDTTSNGITYTKNDDGTINLKGTATAQAGFLIFVDLASSVIENGKTYTLSTNKPLPNGVDVRFELYTDSGWIKAILNGSISSTSPTTTGVAYLNETNATRIRYSFWVASGTTVDISNLGIQLEEGTTANAFTPYYYEENLFDKDTATYVNGWIQNQTMRLNTSNTSRMFYIPCKPNTKYTMSRSVIASSFRITAYDGATFPISTGTNVDYTVETTIENNSATSITYTTGANAKFLVVQYGINTDTNLNETLASIQIQEHIKTLELCNSKVENYQDYIAKNTGKNLFDKDNANVLNAYFNTNTSNITSSSLTRTIYIPCTPNTTYTISKISSARYFVGYTNELPANNVVVNGIVGDITGGTTYTITTGASAKYLCAFVYHSSYDTTITYQQILDSVQLEEGSTATEYEPYGKDEWYKCGKNAIKILNGTETWDSWYVTTNANVGFYSYDTSLARIGVESTYNNSLYCDKFIEVDTKSNVHNGVIQGIKHCGIYSHNQYIGISLDKTKLSDISSKANAINSFKNWLSNNNVTVYYELLTPTYEKITYQPLIDQLNELQNAGLFEGINHITVDTLNELPSLDITVTDLEQDSTSYSGKSFEITGHDYDKGGSIYIYDNPLTYTEALRRIAINGAENLFGLTYTPMEVQSIGHPWLTGKEFVKVTNLENQDLYFYPFDRKISYSGILTTDLSAQAKNEVAQKYENRNTILDKVNHAEISVNKATGEIASLTGTVDDNQRKFTEWKSDHYDKLVSKVGEIDIEVNSESEKSIKSRLSSVEQTTETITSMFQITGGINLIRNSAFLLQDNIWEFTNNGTNPYYTPLGASYNSALSGQTVSVAEIKARSIKIKSKSENITNLKIDKDTKYTFNFYHKQDNNMTTTIKMYSTENNSSKAFNDIVITGYQDFKNYSVSFTPTTYTNYTIEIIVTSTASVGYAYIYDMMLNAGEKQAWQPASDEIYSTTLQMSRLGLKVYSVGDGTITLLGSDGMSTYETSDGVTLGRLVSMRTEAGDRVKTVTSEALYLTKDIREENANRWVETIVTISGTPYKVEYIESGGQ